MADCFI